MKAGLWMLQLAMACVSVASADLEEDLLSEDWMLKQVDGTFQASIRLPGSSLEALEARASVQDSLYRCCSRGKSYLLYGQRPVTDTSEKCLPSGTMSFKTAGCPRASGLFRDHSQFLRSSWLIQM